MKTFRSLLVLALAWAVFAIPASAQFLPGHHSGFQAFGTPTAPQTFISQTVGFTSEIGYKWTTGLADSPRGVMDFCVKGSVGSTANTGPLINIQLIGTTQPASGSSSEISPGTNFTYDNSGTPPGQVRANINDATGSTNHGANAAMNPPTQVNGDFTCWNWVYDVSASPPRSVISRNGVEVINGIAVNGTWSSRTSNLLGALGFSINPQDGAGSQGHANFELTHFFFDTPAVAPVDVSNHLTVPICNFYCSGQAVDQGATGSLALGAQPLVYLTGTPTQWRTNKGSAPNPTVVNADANIDLAGTTKAPGATADRPYLGWIVPGTSLGAQSSGAYTGINNQGNVLGGAGSGDYIFVDVTMEGNGDSTDTHVATVVAGAGGGSAYTLLPNSRQCRTGGAQMCNVVYYKAAEACDATVNQADWACPPAVHWTTNADTFYVSGYTVAVYHNVTSVVTSNGQNNAAGEIICPTLTAPSGKSLRVDWYGPYEWNDATGTGGQRGPPAGQSLRFKFGATNSAANPMVADEPLNAAGATGTRTTTTTGGTPRNNTCQSMILQ